MNIFSKVLVGLLAGALIAGCGTVPTRTGKSNDHVVAYRSQNVEPTREREVVYVDRTPVYQERVYYQRVVPAYRVISSDPSYATVTTRPVYQRTFTTGPVTRYYYYTD
ncbi:hypothetical protein [Dongia deserti]|uniref:hypothetical protein n=1 Tax=Dongia deserti TaxID=2268030 RepID=UPI0013C44D27|nr:hypothetical protein [Dongia deserti]